MSPWRLVIRELLHRKLDFALAALAVVIAVTVLVAQIEVLDRHDRNTEAILARIKGETAREVAAEQDEVAREVANLDDEIRKIMRDMGFNIFILPKRPEPAGFMPEDAEPAFMPEEYVTRLANSTIVTVRHLLPLLEHRIQWDERGGGPFILVGTRGEVPLVSKQPKKPMAQPVEKGTIVLGYKLWSRLKLEAGQTVTLLGRKFTIAKCHGERGTTDDSRAWISLAEAQEMLHARGLIDRKDVISAIWALECSCAWRDLGKVRREISDILPDTVIREDGPKALARAEAREKVAANGVLRVQRVRRQGDEELRREAESRAKLQGQLEMLAALVIPLAILGCAASVGLLAYNSVRRRRREIGILRAIGVRARQVALVFLARAVLLGLLGAAAGCAIGLVVGSQVAEAPEAAGQPGVFDPVLLLIVMLSAPALSALATAAPAMIAGQQDPAAVLQEE